LEYLGKRERKEKKSGKQTKTKIAKQPIESCRSVSLSLSLYFVSFSFYTPFFVSPGHAKNGDFLL
jgi:hypothetical protein